MLLSMKEERWACAREKKGGHVPGREVEADCVAAPTWKDTVPMSFNHVLHASPKYGKCRLTGAIAANPCVLQSLRR